MTASAAHYSPLPPSTWGTTDPSFESMCHCNDTLRVSLQWHMDSKTRVSTSRGAIFNYIEIDGSD